MNAEFEQFAQLIQIELLLYEFEGKGLYSSSSLEEFRRDFIKYEHIDPEVRARQLHYGSLQALMESDTMRKFVIVERERAVATDEEDGRGQERRQIPVNTYRARPAPRQLSIVHEMYVSRMEKERKAERRLGRQRRFQPVQFNGGRQCSLVVSSQNDVPFRSRNEMPQHKNGQETLPNGQTMPISAFLTDDEDDNGEIQQQNFLSSTSQQNDPPSTSRIPWKCWKRFKDPIDLKKSIYRYDGICKEHPALNVKNVRDPRRFFGISRLEISDFPVPEFQPAHVPYSPYQSVSPLTSQLEEMNLQQGASGSSNQCDNRQNDGEINCPFCAKKAEKIVGLQKELKDRTHFDSAIKKFFTEIACQNCFKNSGNLANGYGRSEAQGTPRIQPNCSRNIVPQSPQSSRFTWTEKETTKNSTNSAVEIGRAASAQNAVNSTPTSLISAILNASKEVFSGRFFGAFLERSTIPKGKRNDDDSGELSSILNEFLDFRAETDDNAGTSGKQAATFAKPTPPMFQGKGATTFIWHDKFYQKCPQCPIVPTLEHCICRRHTPIEEEDEEGEEGWDIEEEESAENGPEEEAEEEGEIEEDEEGENDGELGPEDLVNLIDEGEEDEEVNAIGRTFQEITLGSIDMADTEWHHVDYDDEDEVEEEGVEEREEEERGNEAGGFEEEGNGDEYEEEDEEEEEPVTPPHQAPAPPNAIDHCFCHYCNLPFASPKGLKIHKSRSKRHRERVLANGNGAADEEDVFPCDEHGCVSVLNSPELLARHKRRIHAPRVVCDQCGKGYLKEATLARHRERAGH